MKLYEIEFWPEICCDECNEVVHNHFDCPICKKQDASTSIYIAVHEEIEKPGDTFECEECKTTFEYVKSGDEGLVFKVVDEDKL